MFEPSKFIPPIPDQPKSKFQYTIQKFSNIFLSGSFSTPSSSGTAFGEEMKLHLHVLHVPQIATLKIKGTELLPGHPCL